MSKEQAKEKEARVKMLEVLKSKGIEKTILEMENEIKEAIKAGITKNSLDKGRYCGQIVDGKNVSEYHIVRVYTNLITLQAGSKQASKATDAQATDAKVCDEKKPVTNEPTLEAIRLAIAAIAEDNQALRKELEAVKAELKKVCDNNKQSNKPDENKVCDNNKPVTNEPKIIVLGFTLREETTISKGHTYKNWFAKKMIAGKLHRIFVGKDKDLAETKIKTYCLNKAIAIETK